MTYSKSNFISLIRTRAHAYKITVFGLVGTGFSFFANLREASSNLTLILFAFSFIVFLATTIWLNSSFKKPSLSLNAHKNKTVNTVFDVMLVSLALLLTSGLLSLAQMTSDTVGGTNDPVVALLMPKLVGIDKSLTDIQDNTKDTAANTQKIANSVGRLKRETSENPRKELANMGLSWTGKHFFEIVKANDIDSTKLYLDGGFNFRTAVDENYFNIANIFAKHPPTGKMLDLFITHGLNVDDKFSYGRAENLKTMLMMAAVEDQSDWARLLLDRGADLDFIITKEYTTTTYEKTAFTEAIDRKSWETADMLCSKGARSDQDDYNAYRVIVKANFDKYGGERKNRVTPQSLEKCTKPKGKNLKIANLEIKASWAYAKMVSDIKDGSFAIRQLNNGKPEPGSYYALKEQIDLLKASK